jgi:hypothetical protein
MAAMIIPSPGTSNPRPRNRKEPNMTYGPKSDRDNHSNQCNPNHDEYWHSREQ